MEVWEAIEKRREITTYTEQPVDKAVLDKVVRAGYLAPAGNNLPSRELIVVQDRAMLRKLKGATPYVPWLETAAAAIVVIANPGLSKYWLQDASIAGGFMWLAAVSEGLGAAWGAIYHSEDPEESERRESFVREALAIPENLRVVVILGLGYPAALPGPKKMYPIERVLHWENYTPREVDAPR
jgi:nitroreductase